MHFFFSSSSAIPAMSLGFGWDLCVHSVFVDGVCLACFCYQHWHKCQDHESLYDRTIEVVTFCLRGWCVLGVFLLPAFPRPGHKCQDHREREKFRTMECMCAHTEPQIILSSERVVGSGARTHVNSKGKIPSTWRLIRVNTRCYVTQSINPVTL